MKDTTQLIEQLLISTNEYGKTSLKLLLLKSEDKISDGISSFIPYIFFLISVAYFLLFANFGIAIWLGELMGNAFWGFFLVAGFYLLMGAIIHLFLRKWIKRIFHDYIIRKINK
jgi:hypothetical protein